jgi:TonB family protein
MGVLIPILAAAQILAAAAVSTTNGGFVEALRRDPFGPPPAGSSYSRSHCGSLSQSPRQEAPRPLAEAATVEGPLEVALVEAVVRRNAAQIRYCYERELPAKPELAGRVVVDFTIDADGRVPEARIKSTTLNEATVESCVIQCFKKLRFSKPADGANARVSVPLIFGARGD